MKVRYHPDVDYLLTQIAEDAFVIKETSGLSFRQIAKKMGLSSPSQVQRIVDCGSPHNARLSTLVRFGLACGYTVEVKFRSLNTKEVTNESLAFHK